MVHRRGRYQHLMVARTRISDGYLARARAIVALARSWRPTEALPGARAWRDAAAAAHAALAGLAGHLAIEPPPDHHGHDNHPDGGPPAGHAARAGDAPARQLAGEPAEPLAVTAARHRLRLAVAAAARDGDQEATAALVREATRRGLDAAELVAVAERHWPKPRLRVRAWRAGRRWTTGSLRRLHQPRQAASAVAEREARP